MALDPSSPHSPDTRGWGAPAGAWTITRLRSPGAGEEAGAVGCLPRSRDQGRAAQPRWIRIAPRTRLLRGLVALGVELLEVGDDVLDVLRAGDADGHGRAGDELLRVRQVLGEGRLGPGHPRVLVGV